MIHWEAFKCWLYRKKRISARRPTSEGYSTSAWRGMLGNERHSRTHHNKNLKQTELFRRRLRVPYLLFPPLPPPPTPRSREVAFCYKIDIGLVHEVASHGDIASPWRVKMVYVEASNELRDVELRASVVLKGPLLCRQIFTITRGRRP